MWWKADVEWRRGLLEKGSRGTFLAASPDFGLICRHRGVNHDIEQDGLVAILTVVRL